MGLKFEHNLPHQKRAVDSILKVFEGLPISEHQEAWVKLRANPIIDNSGIKYKENIKAIADINSIPVKPTGSNIIDIMMETGTGKTYTYTKAIFELNKNFGIYKFIVVVPTLSIKAGTVNFLRSDSARQHFKDEYGKTINLYVVESKKGKKNTKGYMPTSVSEFTNAQRNDNTIEVLLINAGMLNSDTMSKHYDKLLMDRYFVPMDALASVKPFVIIDEPHRFPNEGRTWKNIKKLKPQYILRFGATFKEFENLVYTLTAVEAFNQNLVKGVIGHIEEFEGGKNAFVRLVNTDGQDATFELVEGEHRMTLKLSKGESLERIHRQMEGLLIEKMNETEVLLSNGLSLRKGDKLNPYSFSFTLEEKMIEVAIRKHFEIEEELIEERHRRGRSRIKPITLFFIDNIEEYRERDGKLREAVERYIKAYAEEAMEETEDEFYRAYLEKALEDVSKTHGGYFSRDNVEKDEEIEEEVNKILHDKERLLSFDDPMRFIFSKWTLREGWDNPNVFQICKLRSSGSEISKLQEVGRGLRLPVNEYMNREKGEFYLHYYVDFTESDFVERLVGEIREKSLIGMAAKPEKITEDMVSAICDRYGVSEDDVYDELIEEGIIKKSHKFTEGGFEKLMQKYPEAFSRGDLAEGKVRSSRDKRKRCVRVRKKKYRELKELWEKLSQKIVMEYKVKDEKEFKEIFKSFIRDNVESFVGAGVVIKEKRIETDKENVYVKEKAITERIESISTMRYGEFIKELALAIKMNIRTIHEAFRELLEEGVLDINEYLNPSTIRAIRYGFDNYLLQIALTKLEVEYKKVEGSIHPTKLTDMSGNPLPEIDASDVGVMYSDERVADSFYFKELFFDSQLEKENIMKDLEEVVAFLKIPKNSIKIPVPGGKSYSPDFAYVLRSKDRKKKIYFVVETKDKEEIHLSKEEMIKMDLAKKIFGDGIKVVFEKQMKDKKIEELIRNVLSGNA